jgi:hypothetical protein
LQIIRSEEIYLAPSDLPYLILTGNGFVSLVLGLVISAFHAQAVLRARAVVLADKTRYDRVWGRVLRDDTQRRAVEDLASRARLLLSRLDARSSAPARQFNRCRLGVAFPSGEAGTRNPASRSSEPSPVASVRSFPIRIPSLSEWLRGMGIKGSPSPPESDSSILGARAPGPDWWPLLDCGVPAMLDVQRPVNSLDQLYFQAAALNPILIGKIQAWALANGGCFQVEPTGRAPASKDSLLVSLVGCRYWLNRATMALRRTSVSQELGVVAAAAAALGSEPIPIDEVDRSETRVPCGCIRGTGPADTPGPHSQSPLQGECNNWPHSDHSVADGESADDPDGAAGLESAGRQRLPPEYARWKAIREKELRDGGTVKWGSIKSVQRALEKSTRSYGAVSGLCPNVYDARLDQVLIQSRIIIRTSA